MKTGYRICRRAGLLLAAAACSPPALAFDWHHPLRTPGSGKIVHRELEIPAFDSIELSGDIALELEQSQQPRLIIDTDDNIVPLIEVVSKGRNLSLRFHQRIAPTQLRIVANVWALERIVLSGSSSLRSSTLVSKNLRMQLGGSASVKLSELTAETVGVQIGGSASARLAGQANELSAALGGSAMLNAAALRARRVNVALGGSGSAQVHATESLTGTVAGSSELRYRGEARVSVTKTGSSRVLQQS